MSPLRLALLTMLTLIACAAPPQVDEVLSDSGDAVDHVGDHHIIYVPAYSHVYHGNQPMQRFQLAITLSVHNISFRDSITVHKIHYTMPMGS